MKIYRTQSEVEKDIKNRVLAIEGDVTFECSISISASIIVTAGNINARDINARNINAWNINAWDINASDINARDITARDISYYAFCCVYQNIKCLSIKARRTTSKEPICLDGKFEIKEPEQNSAEKEAIKLLKDNGYKIIKE